MILKDYLNREVHDRRILIVSDIVRGNALIRLHERKTGRMVRNVNCMTIAQMTDVLYRYILSTDGFDEEKEFLESTEAMLLFRKILFKNLESLRYFNNDKMMDLATTFEIFRKANLVRTNGWSGEEEKHENKRVSDLKLLISEYEDKLSTDNMIDQVAKEKYVLEKVKSFSSFKDELRYIFAAEISYLAEDVETFNGVESELLEAFRNAEDAEIHVFENIPSLDELRNCKGKTSFFRGYGSFNEASYIANDIFEKVYPFGNVTVLYSSSSQIPAIEAALSGNGIPMNIVSNHPISDNAYISLAKRIITWAEDDYSEKALDAILLSPIISVQVDDGFGNMINALSGQKYFDHILNAHNRRDNGYTLGWGYDRNAGFIEHEKKHAKDDSVKEVLKMQGALLDIFSDSGKPYGDENKIRPIIIYEKLVAFIEKYSSRDADYAIGIDSIKRLSGAVRVEERALSLKEVLEFIKELLSTVVISDSEETTAVKVQAMKDWCLLDRPVVYVIGLSLKDMQGNTTESPVLFDNEMENFLSTGYVPTIKNETDIRESHLLYSLSSFDGESITFGYSNYDTVNFWENNASAFFREALSAFGSGSIKDLPEFVYGNPSDPVLPLAIPACKDKSSYDVKLETSSSSLEVLLDCPKKFAYDKIMHIPDNEFSECNYGQWLDARLKGSFFHKIVEEYCNSRLVLKASEAYETVVDKTVVEMIAKKEESHLLFEAPYAFKKLADRETEDLIEDATEYLQTLIDELNGPLSWRVLKAEQKFVEASYSVKSFDGKEYPFELTGYIDRIDYRIDKASGKCFIRIVDYKTGKREKKDNENKLGKLIQYAVYKKALMETGKAEDDITGVVPIKEYICDLIAGLEEDNSVKDLDLEFECFQYVFPLDKSSKAPFVINESDLEGINLIRLKSILATIEHKHTYPDHKELIDTLAALATDYPNDAGDINNLLSILTGNKKKETENCEYCAYKYLCTNRKASEL